MHILFGSSCSQVFLWECPSLSPDTSPAHLSSRMVPQTPSEALTTGVSSDLCVFVLFCFVFGLDRTPSLLRAAIEQVTRDGYKPDPSQGGVAFLNFLGDVIQALGGQGAHFRTDNLELQRRVARLYRALQHQKEAEAYAARPGSVPFPPLRGGRLVVMRQEITPSSRKSEQTSQQEIAQHSQCPISVTWPSTRVQNLPSL